MADFSELASTGLPSLGGSYDNPTWNRSLMELQAASDSLWTGNNLNQQTPDSASRDNATRNTSLLGDRQLPQLGRLAGSLETGLGGGGGATPRAETDFLQWGEANKRREIDILKRFVSKAEETTRKISQELIEKQLQEDWERTRDLWAKELVGTRTLGGSATEPTASNHLMLENSSTSTGHTPLLLSSAPVNQKHPTGSASRYVDPQTVRGHMEIVKRLQKHGHLNVQVLCQGANEMAKLAESSSQYSPQNAFYATALQLTSRVMARDSLNSVEIALGTLGHSSDQFETWMVSKVRNASLTGGNQGSAQPMPSTHYKSANANTIATFVSLELGATMETSFWPALYYALRIGDAVAAKEIFESNSAGAENDDTKTAIVQVLSSLVQRQGTAASIWEAHGPLVFPAQYMRNIGEACERAKTAEGRPDFHRIGFLSLLSGVSELPTADSLAGFSTIEDYLFGLLWMALQKPEPVSELDKAGKRILSFGSNYFGDQDGGWLYALPLLAVQQYHTALSYLVQVGGATGLMQATHLGILLASCGSTLDNLGETNPHPENNLITSLLVDYAAWLHADSNSGASCALEYLVWIPAKAQLVKEVVALMLRADDVHVLAGGLSSEGTRQEGAMDNYFSKAEISTMIKQAAEILAKDATTNRQKASAAGVLFMLAGDFRSVLLLLSRLLSPDTDVQNEDKRYWYQQARTFFSTYLQNGRSHVYECLEKNDDSDAVRTCQTLMGFFDFFDCIANGAFEHAWDILDNLDILPKSQSDLSSKEVRYRSLDPLVQKQIPAVLMAAMHSLHHQHARLKNSGDVTSQNVLVQLKEKARGLITFAGLISDVDPDKVERMSRLEANMI